MLTQFDIPFDLAIETHNTLAIGSPFNLHFFSKFRNAKAEELLSTLQRVCYNLDAARLDMARAASIGSWLQPAHDKST